MRQTYCFCWNSHGHQLCPIVNGPILFSYETAINKKKMCTLHVKKNLLGPSTQQSGESTTYHPFTIVTAILTSDRYIPVNLN